MANQAPTRRERAARVAADTFAPIANRQLLKGLGDVVNRKVPLGAIEPNPQQPRQGVDETSAQFRDLVGSIQQQGLLQPISLWQTAEDEERYTIIAGERRWRAFRFLADTNPTEYGRIPATVLVLAGDNPQAKALMMAIIENVVREDLKDGERSDALMRLKTSTGWTYEEISERMGLSVKRVHDLASIARHDAVRDAVNDGRLTQKQAIAIAQGVSDAALAAELVERVGGLDAVATRAVVREARSIDASTPPEERARTAVANVQSIPVLGERSPIEVHTIPVRAHGRRVGAAVSENVVVAATPLARLIRRRAVPREELAEILQATCEQLDVWPQRSPEPSVERRGGP